VGDDEAALDVFETMMASETRCVNTAQLSSSLDNATRGHRLKILLYCMS
jgi:hypothetical protein